MTLNDAKIRLGLAPQDERFGNYIAIPVRYRSRTRRILSYLRHAGGRLKH